MYFLCTLSIQSRAHICKRLWRPGIDSEEPIPPAYEAWRRSGTTKRVVVPAWQARNRFLGSLKVYKYGLWDSFCLPSFRSFLLHVFPLKSQIYTKKNVWPVRLVILIRTCSSLPPPSSPPPHYSPCHPAPPQYNSYTTSTGDDTKSAIFTAKILLYFSQKLRKKRHNISIK